MKTRTTFIVSLTAILTLAAGSAFGAYSGGNGTTDAPYQIATKADLLVLATNTADYSKCFILTADIDMQGQVFTTAIIAPDTVAGNDNSFDGTAFTGTFDGNGHKITNFTINDGSNSNCYLGLFGYINSSGSVKNLGLENFAVSGSSNSWYVGGLVGLNYSGTISNCYSTGSVSGHEPVGGLVGYNYGSIGNCYSTGTVSGSDGSAVGVGGLVGWNDGSVSNCYSTGAVSGYQVVGGLVGYSYEGSISICYSTGAVSGSWDVGGLAGRNDNGNIRSSYFFITSGPDNGYGTPLTDAQMKQQSSFVGGWDFTTIWRVRCEGMNYPKLNWQVIPAADWVCPDGVDFADFAYFAEWWQTTGCDSSNNFCGGADMDTSGTVDIFDLAEFAGYWLSGS
jgi:The GLUG motif